jgi:hypothetical protein
VRWGTPTGTRPSLSCRSLHRDTSVAVHHLGAVDHSDNLTGVSTTRTRFQARLRRSRIATLTSSVLFMSVLLAPATALADTHLRQSEVPLLSVAEALKVQLNFSRAMSAAMNSGSPAALSRLTVPGIVRDAYLLTCASTLYGNFYGACSGGFEPTSAETSVIVPLEKHYPLYFLSQSKGRGYVETYNTSSSDGGFMQLEVLTKRGPSSPWQVAFDTNFYSYPNLQVIPEFFYTSSNSAGLDEPSTVRPPLATSDFPSLLDTYLQSCIDRSAVPTKTLFVNAGSDDAYLGCLHAAQGQQGAVDNFGRRDYNYLSPGNSATQHWQFGVDAPGVISGPNTLLMDCFSVAIAQVYKPGPGSAVLVQPQDQSEYGPALPPGRYASVTENGLHSVCLVTDGQHLWTYGYRPALSFGFSGTLAGPGVVV